MLKNLGPKKEEEELCSCGCGKPASRVVREIMRTSFLNQDQAGAQFRQAQEARAELAHQ